MLQSWCSRGQVGTTTTPDDTRTLALHVLAFVAFQKSYPFGSISHSTAQDQNSFTYRDSISIILENVLVIMVLPERAFTLPFMPKSFRQVGWAIKSFRDYMAAQVTAEKKLIQNGEYGAGTLVSNLVRASDEGAATNSDSGHSNRLKPLTNAEILGNIFVFNFAGHDTTAISLAYGMLLLVAHPEVQDWLHEEIELYTRNQDHKQLAYNETFPKLKRCLAVLVSLAPHSEFLGILD
jgi:cytochrome P450